ncbi:MAG: serine protease, partial [Paracoccaceae bacterium]
VEMETLARDSASELALLRPKDIFTAASYALFSREEPTLGTEITVAGFSFPDVMDIAALNYGTLTANAGTKGDETRMRVSAFLEAGDVGGPVLNDRGAVIGMVLLRGSQGTNLPEYVNFAIKTDRILALLNSGNYAYGRSTTREPVDLEDLAFMAGDFTVKVSCWK